MTSSDEITAGVTLWSGYVRAKSSLRHAGLVRSFKSAEADFSEWLVAQLLEGELSPNQSNPYWDVMCEAMRVQVKSLCKSSHNTNGYIIRPEDRVEADIATATHYAFVFFKELEPDIVFLVSSDVLRSWPQTQIHRRDLADHPSVKTIWSMKSAEPLHHL